MAASAMKNPLTRKLQAFTALSREDEALLDRLVTPVRAVAGRNELVLEGQRPADIKLIVGGFACRYRSMPDGRRQILSFMIPGDFSELYRTPPRSMDYGVATITACQVVDLDRKRLESVSGHPAIEEALRVCSFSEEAITREWLINVGRRNATERVAHLLCEFVVRLQVLGLSDGHRADFPITEGDLADCTSLSVVQVNRVLRDMKQSGILSLNGSDLVLHDLDRLKRIGGFLPAYLQLNDDFLDVPGKPGHDRPDRRPTA